MEFSWRQGQPHLQTATIREMSYLVLALEHNIFVSQQEQQVSLYNGWGGGKRREGVGDTVREGRSTREVAKLLKNQRENRGNSGEGVPT